MDIYQNPKVIGAFLVGFALVAGAYVVATFGQPRSVPVAAVVNAEEAPVRTFIPVSDNDLDGIEDWRDQFVVGPAVTVAEENTVDYVAPSSLTGKLGVSLMEGVLISRAAGPISRSEEQVVADTVEQVSETVSSDKIYDVKDIIMGPDSASSSVRVYANAMADIIIKNNPAGLEHELLLLQDMLTYGDESKLLQLAEAYKTYRDESLKTQVPRNLVKVHLDLINVYNALYNDIKVMTEAKDDPIVTLARLKRYEDDDKGLWYAIGNIYNAIVPYASEFRPSDSALAFSQLYQTGP